MQLIVQKRGYRAVPILVLALLALGLTAVFAHGDPAGENADNHIGTDCDAVGSPGPPCASSVERVAGVEVDADLTAGDADGTATEVHCGVSIDSHGGPAGSDGKDWDACPRSGGPIFGDSADALINEGGAASPAACPPIINPAPSAPASVFWNQGPGILICDRSAFMSDNDEKDNVFTGGSKTTEEKLWDVATPGAPKKGDLDYAGFFRGKGVSGDTAGSLNDDWIVGFISKTDTDGDSHNFFELRQAFCSTDLSTIETCPRTTGDILVIVDTSSVDNKITVTIFEWFEFADFPTTEGNVPLAPACPAISPSIDELCKGDGVDDTASVPDDCVIPTGDFASKTNGCWDPIPASHPTVIGIFNFDGVSATGSGVPPENADDEILAGPWGAFGCERTTDNTSTGCKPRTHHAGRELLEFAANLDALGISPECPGFGTLLGGGRSSSSLDAELKDALPAVNLPLECSIAWEKRDGSTAVSGVHPLQGGATFTVDGDNNNNGDGIAGGDGPFRCLDADTVNDFFDAGMTVGDESDPITVVDDNDGPDFANLDFDADPDLGQVSVPSLCFGTYTITETAAPSGYLKDSDTTRVIVVDGNNLSPVVGTQSTDDHQGTAGTGIADCTSTPEECDFHNRLGTIEWEKRDESSPDINGKHPLQGGATFTVGQGATPANGDGNGPFACQDSNNEDADDNNPVTVVDNSAPDADSDAGQLKLDRVCIGDYTITETAAPAGFERDDDLDRPCNVTAILPNCVVGSALADPPADSLDDHEGTGTGIANCTGTLDECDFHNRKGSLLFLKVRKDKNSVSSQSAFPGATFNIVNSATGATTDPTGGSSSCPGSIANCIQVTDDTDGTVGSGLDRDPSAGSICVDNILINAPLTITETATNDSGSDYLADTTPRSATVTGSSRCADRVGFPATVGDAENNAANPCTDPGATGNCGTATACTGAGVGVDDDGDAIIDDGCSPTAGAPDTLNLVFPAAAGTAENNAANTCPGGDPDCGSAAACATLLGRGDDDDNDGTVDDGCPAATGQFVNIPLSEIEVICRSLGNLTGDDGDVTRCSIVCTGPDGVEGADGGGLLGGDITDEDGAADPAFDDVNEVFTDLAPRTYTCTVVIDP